MSLKSKAAPAKAPAAKEKAPIAADNSGTLRLETSERRVAKNGSIVYTVPMQDGLWVQIGLPPDMAFDGDLKVAIAAL